MAVPAAQSSALKLRAEAYVSQKLEPTLKEALVSLCRARPENPVEFLAQELLRMRPDLPPRPLHEAERQCLVPEGDWSRRPTLEDAISDVVKLRHMLRDFSYRPLSSVRVKDVPIEPGKKIAKVKIDKDSAEGKQRQHEMPIIQPRRFQWVRENTAKYVNMLRDIGHNDDNIQHCLKMCKPLSFPTLELYEEFVADLEEAARKVEERTNGAVHGMRIVLSGSANLGFSVTPLNGAMYEPTSLFDPKKSDVDARIYANGFFEYMQDLIAKGVKPKVHKFNPGMIKCKDASDTESILEEIAAVQRKWKAKLGEAAGIPAGIPVEFTLFMHKEYNFEPKPWSHEVVFASKVAHRARHLALGASKGDLTPRDLSASKGDVMLADGPMGTPPGGFRVSLHTLGMFLSRELYLQCLAPLDGSDCLTLEEARETVVTLRGMLRGVAFVPLTSRRVHTMPRVAHAKVLERMAAEGDAPPPSLSAAEVALRSRTAMPIHKARFDFLVEQPEAYVNMLRSVGWGDTDIQQCLDRAKPLHYRSLHEYESFVAALSALAARLAERGLTAMRCVQESALGYSLSPLHGAAYEPTSLLAPADGTPLILRASATGLQDECARLKAEGKPMQRYGYEKGFDPNVLKPESARHAVPELGELLDEWGARLGREIVLRLFLQPGYNFDPKHWEREFRLGGTEA